MNDLKYKCPKCGNESGFKSAISVIAIVDHEGEVLEELNRYIFRSFMMTCQECGYSTASKAFSDCAEKSEEKQVQKPKEKIIEFKERKPEKVQDEPKSKRRKIKVEC